MKTGMHVGGVVCLWLAVLILAGSQVSAATLHVVPGNGGATAPYTNWGLAAGSLADAVAVAGAGDRILLTNGVHVLTGTVAISEAITVSGYGGSVPVVVDGCGSNRCFQLSHSNAVLCDLTVTGGSGLLGGGVYMAGGGLVSNCVVVGNVASGAGGGVYGWGFSRVMRCVVGGNRSGADGGGLFLTNGARVVLSVITGNVSGVSGGGVAMREGCELYGCLVVSNSAALCGGVLCGSGCRLAQSTVVGNEAACGGVLFQGGGVLSNSVVYYNGATNWAGVASVVTYSCTWPAAAGVSNLAAAPRFAGVGAGDYRLAVDSPCVDAGARSLSGEVDLDGRRRAINLATDMGAYELDHVPVLVSDPPLYAPTGREYRHDLAIVDPDVDDAVLLRAEPLPDWLSLVDTAARIETVCGNGTNLPFAGDGGPATNATIDASSGLALDSAGNIYVCDSRNCRVRKVSVSGTITTFAGTDYGDSGDGGAATAAQFNSPYGVAIDRAGVVYVADFGASRVRKILLDGTIHAFAGDGLGSYGGDGGPASNAQIRLPQGLAVDAQGNVYIADYGNHRIRRVDTNGVITTVAGTGESGFSGDGGPAIAARLYYPAGVAVAPDGRIYIADSSNNRIRRIREDGILETVAGSGGSGHYGDGGSALAARLWTPRGVWVDPVGQLYLGDSNNNRIRFVGADGNISTYAGFEYLGYETDGDTPTNTILRRPTALQMGADGCLYFLDSGNYRVRKITPGRRMLVGTPGTEVEGLHKLSLQMSDGSTNVVRDFGLVVYGPPRVAVSLPRNGAEYLQHERVVFAGGASNVPVGQVSAVRWVSDRDGVLGGAGSITNGNLTPGMHQVQVVVTDAASRTGSAMVAVYVWGDPMTNGLPAVWMARYWPLGGSGGADNDWDGDGLSNVGEWLAGTDPTNRASCFTVRLNPDRLGAWRGFRFAHDVISNRVYEVGHASNLFDGFVAFTNFSVVPGQAVLNWTYTNDWNSGLIFYRVKVSR